MYLRKPNNLQTICLFVALVLTSCEDKELAAQRDAQQLELVELEDRVERLQLEVSQPVADVSDELEQTLAELEAIALEIIELKGEAEEFAASQAEEEAALADFQKRYPIRN